MKEFRTEGACISSDSHIFPLFERHGETSNLLPALKTFELFAVLSMLRLVIVAYPLLPETPSYRNTEGFHSARLRVEAGFLDTFEWAQI